VERKFSQITPQNGFIMPKLVFLGLAPRFKLKKANGKES
jgi:hypothetical protein